ncbi:MAG TPA: formaldehyde-activating enzyme [Nocardioides sp.]|nr:formaldehyde-activating enzyme [Nocardioides sp.]
MSDTVYQVGESFIGSGPNAAHINTVLGSRLGPVGTAWATALATPSPGHVPFMAVLQPGVPVKPATLFVTKAAPEGDDHGTMIWGPAQAGVAGGVADAVASGALGDIDLDEVVLICAVWVNPAADDAEEVYRNNREATATALTNGVRALPGTAEVLAARGDVRNPFFTPADPAPPTP